MITELQFLCIKTDTAPKTSLNAKGGVTYAVLKDVDSTDAFLCLLENDGGGYFSREAVPLADILRCLTNVNIERPVLAKTFRQAFIGRSVNNAGFLVHALRHEGLLKPAPDAAHQHIVGDGWDAWKTSVLAQVGQPFVLPDAKKADAALATTGSDEQVAATGKKGKKSKKSEQPATVNAEQAGDDNAASS